MAPKKGASKAGKRSRTTSVSSATGVTTRGASRRSKTPATQPAPSASAQPSQQSSSEQKSHTGRVLRSRTKGGDASPLRAGLDETTVRRSNRRTASPAIQRAPTPPEIQVDISEDDQEDLIQQQLLDEASAAADNRESSTDIPPALSSEIVIEDILETIETDAEPAEVVEVDQLVHDQILDSEIEIKDDTTSVIEIEDDEPVEVEEVITVEDLDVNVEQAEPPTQETVTEITVAEEPLNQEEPAQPEEASEVEETSQVTVLPTTSATRETRQRSRGRSTSPAKVLRRTEVKHDNEAVSPGPESDGEDGFVDFKDGNDTFLQIPRKNALKFFMAKCKTLESENTTLRKEMSKIKAEMASLKAPHSTQSLTRLENIISRVPQPAAVAPPSLRASEDAVSETAPEYNAPSMPPEYAAYLQPKPAIDFAALIEQHQENDAYGMANKLKQRRRAVERKRRGESLTAQENGLVAEYEAEQRAAQLERNLADTPGSFTPRDRSDVAVTVTTPHGSLQKTPSASSGNGFTARLMQTVQSFSPTRLLGGWTGSTSPAKTTNKDHPRGSERGDTISPAGSRRKRKAETEADDDTQLYPPPSTPRFGASRTPRAVQQRVHSSGAESPLQESVMESPSFKRQRVDRNRSHQTPRFEPALTPVSERTNESSLLQTLQKPTQPQTHLTPRASGRRVSVRSARRADHVTTPLSQAKRDFISQSSNRRQSAREQILEQDEHAPMDDSDATTTGPRVASTSDYMPANTGQKRKIHIARGAEIPQAREGYGFDYDDYSFEEDDSTMIDAPEDEPDSKLQEEIARTTEEFSRLPPAAQENRYPGISDTEWLKRMKTLIVLHGSANQKMGSRFSNGFRSNASADRSARPILTPVAPSKRLTADQQQMLDRDGTIPGTPLTGRTIGVPISDEDSNDPSTSVSTPAPAATTSTTTTAAPPTSNNLFSSSTPATTRRATHEQYKPRQPSRLREETTVQESSESDREAQPPTPPTHDEMTFKMFKDFMAIQPGPRLDVSPEFLQWSRQPGWEKGMADWIDRLDLPLSKKNCGV